MESLSKIEAFVKAKMRNFKITFTKLKNVRRDVITDPIERPEDWYSIYRLDDKFVLKFGFTDEVDSNLVKTVNSDIVTLVDE